VEEASLLVPVQRVVGGVQIGTICSGGRPCASRNSVTGNASIAAASYADP